MLHLAIWVVSGLIAGALARIVMKSRSRGYVGDIVLGLLGGVAGAWLLRLVQGEVPEGGFANIASAFAGAVLLVAGGRLVVWVAQGAGQYAPEVTRLVTLPDLDGQIRKLTELERSVLSRLLGHRTLSDPTEIYKQKQTLGERVADRVAQFGGSWTFLGCFAAFMLGWMFINTTTRQKFDTYPFILLNLILSCLAAVQAPVIMMSQNRQSAKDRFDAQQDYQVNLRTELQITELHMKLDEARAIDRQALVLAHQQQLEILERLERVICATPAPASAPAPHESQRHNESE